MVRSICFIALAAGMMLATGQESSTTADSKASTFATPASDNATLTAVEGVKVGHFTLAERPTGCTVVLLKDGTTGGVDVRGGAPGTRETDLLNPVNSVQIVNAIMLSGGSAYGLDAATGVDEAGSTSTTSAIPSARQGSCRSFPPRSCSTWGSAGIRESARRPTVAIARRRRPRIGRAGGERRGRRRGNRRKRRSGQRRRRSDEGRHRLVGDQAAKRTRRRRHRRRQCGRRHRRSRDGAGRGRRAWTGRQAGGCEETVRQGGARDGRAGENTTIGVVATNARLTKVQAQKVAQMAHDGYARAIAPVHTPADGDTIFSVATGTWDGQANYGTIGALAAEAMADAIVRAATQATASNNLPAARDLGTVPARFKQ